MEFLVPGLLETRAAFRRNVAVPVERFGDEATADRLKRGVSPFLLRRMKSDPTVIDDLPEKIESRQYCPLTPEQARLYQLVFEETMERISGADDSERRGHVLGMLTRLKQICNHPAQYLGEAGPLEGRSGKLDRCLDLVENVCRVGERALVFTQYREMGTLLQRHLQEHLGIPVPFLHGGTPVAGRDAMVRTFQQGDAQVLLVSLRAGGTGLNLTRATHVVHFDRWWNPAVEDQATDRAYRIGQRRNVQVHKLVCQDTLEERIDAMLEDKRALALQVVGTGERWVTELDDQSLRRLIALGDDAVVVDA
jgi:SNF2 family DNA or RNA helicase